MGKLIDLTGKRFGRLVVVRRNGTWMNRHILWECKCDCGNITTVNVNNLRNGTIKGCGCLRSEKLKTRNTKHGMTSSKEYSVWCGMKSRCYNASSQYYNNYGGRGITVCISWIHSFEKFFEDMGKCPSGFTLERINNDLGYSPENCKWASRKDQSINKRNVKLYTYNGETRCLKDWAENLGICKSTLQDRLKNGWSNEEAFSTPKLSRKSIRVI